MSAQDLGKITITTNGDYNAVTAYEKLSMVRYNGATYISKQSTTGNTPSASSDYWQLVSSDGSDFDPTCLAPAYSSSATYDEGDLCTHSGDLYQANQDISVAEAWTAAHWTAVDVETLLNGMKTSISSLVQATDTDPGEGADMPAGCELLIVYES